MSIFTKLWEAVLGKTPKKDDEETREEGLREDIEKVGREEILKDVKIEQEAEKPREVIEDILGKGENSEDNVKEGAQEFGESILGIEKRPLIETRIDKEKIEEAKTRIRREGRYRVTIESQEGNMTEDRIYINYRKLIGKKILEDDKRLMDFLIKNRKDILKERTNCHIYLFSGERLLMTLLITGILIDNRKEILSFWLGLEINFSIFGDLVEKFRHEMYQIGIRSVSYSQKDLRLGDPKKDKPIINRVTTLFTFA